MWRELSSILGNVEFTSREKCRLGGASTPRNVTEDEEIARNGLCRMKSCFTFKTRGSCPNSSRSWSSFFAALRQENTLVIAACSWFGTK